MDALTLIANPGSASRKYALYRADTLLATLHFEYVEGQIICTSRVGDRHHPVDVDLHDLGDVAGQVLPILKHHNLMSDQEKITQIGLRIVAPSSYFFTGPYFNRRANRKTPRTLPTRATPYWRQLARARHSS